VFTDTNPSSSLENNLRKTLEIIYFYLFHNRDRSSIEHRLEPVLRFTQRCCSLQHNIVGKTSTSSAQQRIEARIFLSDETDSMIGLNFEPIPCMRPGFGVRRLFVSIRILSINTKHELHSQNKINDMNHSISGLIGIILHLLVTNSIWFNTLLNFAI